MYFVDSEGNYKFDAEKLGHAHSWCQQEVYLAMATNWERIVVSNTFTTEKEMKPYFELAERYKFRVYSLIVENRHNGVNSHGAPEGTIEKMKNRFQIHL